MEYGLIGAKLGHSFSKLIHEQLGGYAYELCELPDEAQARAFFAQRDFKAVNVTMPYKQLALACCDVVDARARAIGAVNTVVNRDGVLHGYNTDFDGFLYMTKRKGIAFAGKTVLVLGTGGTQHTAAAVAQSEGAAVVLRATRTIAPAAAPDPSLLTYAQAAARDDVEIVVNTSPVGMYPHNEGCPIDLAPFPRLEAVVDVVYNPLHTRLQQQAQARGIPALGGLRMLVAQAKYAAEYFTDTTIPDSEIERIYRDLCAKQANVVLIGMPSCGKTSLGKLLAQRLGKPFVDLDEALEQRAGKPICEILTPGNETAFRDLESAVTADFAKRSGQVLSTGGGVVLRRENVDALRQNGVVLYIDRPLELLTPGGGRPLSQSREALTAQHAVRTPLYLDACHVRVHNGDDPLPDVARIMEEAFYEVLDTEWA